MGRLFIKILTVLALCFAVSPALAFAATNPAVNSGGGANTSFNWSGYVATGGTFTGVNGSWAVAPVAASAGAEADATWVGIGGVSSSNLIQIGTQAITQNGAVSYEAWYELLPAVSTVIPVTVHAGDSISASLQQEQSNVWLISLTDNTTGQNYSTTVSYTSSLSSAEWIEEMPSDQNGFIPLDNFGSVSFANAAAVENGTTVTPTEANAFSLTMIANAEQALAVPSPLGADGASFTVSRTPVAATVAPRTVQLDGQGGFRRRGDGGDGVSSYRPPAQTSVPAHQSFRFTYGRRFGGVQSRRFTLMFR